MTICIAAIINGGVVGAADRLLTTPAHSFDTKESKIHRLGDSSVVVMIAGDDMSLQWEILERMDDWKLQADGNVYAAVEQYQAIYHTVITQRIESAAQLPRWGLKLDQLLRGEHALPDSVVEEVYQRVQSYSVPATETLIVGVDHRGPHIHRGENDSFQSMTKQGVAAIGSGAQHADSEFRFASHVTKSDAPNARQRALLLTYLAKKRAEASEFVGPETEMFMIPETGVYLDVGSTLIPLFAEVHEMKMLREQEAIEDAYERMNELVYLTLGKRDHPATDGMETGG